MRDGLLDGGGSASREVEGAEGRVEEKAAG